MIKVSVEILPEAFLKVFNNILTSGRFPESWTGNSLDPNKYRGICVSSCMGKLFCSIMNNRLLNFANKQKLIHLTQIAFMPGNRTADHILTLKRGCPQKSNTRRPRRKNRFCSNFAKIYLIISENAPYIFLGQILF